jgi:hypothetical protein
MGDIFSPSIEVGFVFSFFYYGFCFVSSLIYLKIVFPGLLESLPSSFLYCLNLSSYPSSSSSFCLAKTSKKDFWLFGT